MRDFILEYPVLSGCILAAFILSALIVGAVFLLKAPPPVRDWREDFEKQQLKEKEEARKERERGRKDRDAEDRQQDYFRAYEAKSARLMALAELLDKVGEWSASSSGDPIVHMIRKEIVDTIEIDRKNRASISHEDEVPPA